MMDEVKYRWDISFGLSSKELAQEYETTGQAKRRKDGQLDMRYRASRFVDSVRRGGNLFA